MRWLLVLLLGLLALFVGFYPFGTPTAVIEQDPAAPTDSAGPETGPETLEALRAPVAEEPVEREKDPPEREPSSEKSERFALAPWGNVFPPDPVEPGLCSMVLRLVDASSGEAVTSKIRLWRLDAPGNGTWSRGDQCQRTLEVPKGGATLEGLASGRYRVVPLDAGKDAPDPTAFTVSAPLSHAVLPIELPKERTALLELYDGHGRWIDRASWRRGGDSYTRTNPSAPSWVQARTLETEPAEEPLAIGGGAGGSFGYRSGRYREIEAGPQGFVLGPFRDDSKGARRSARVSLRVDGMSEVTVRVRGHDPDDRVYVGVVVDPTTVLPWIVRPDGQPVDPTLLDIGSEAILRSDARSTPGWAEVPITVSLKYRVRGEYEPFSFTFTLADGLSERVELIPKIHDRSGSDPCEW